MGVKVKFFRGAWTVFINHRGRRKFKKIGDREAAMRVKREVEERLARADLQLPAAVFETVRSYAETWLAAAAVSLKGSTVRFYRDNLENHIYPLLGAIPLAQVARADVKRLLVALRGKSLGPTTTTGVLRTLSTVLSEAVEEGKLVGNPALRPGRLRRQLRDPNALRRTPIDPYSRDEVELLVATATAKYPEWATFLLCAVRTGLRLGELRALEWGDIDWQERFIQVERNFVEGVSTVPKSGRGRRVDLSLQLRGALRLWRRRQAAQWFARGMKRPDLVFPSDTRAPLDDSRIRKALKAIAVAADVRARRSNIHVLRHTFASLLIQQGESLVYVKEQLGHASIQITVDVYGHLLPGGNRRAVDRLDSAPSDASLRNLRATGTDDEGVKLVAKSFILSGEPPRNRTENPQIKSSLAPAESPAHLNDSDDPDGQA